MFIKSAKETTKKKVKRRNKLVEDNLQLVYYWGRRYYENTQRPTLLDLEDATQEAAISALVAADRWDPKRENTKSFAGYVYDMEGWRWNEIRSKKSMWSINHHQEADENDNLQHEGLIGEGREGLGLSPERQERVDLVREAISRLDSKKQIIIRKFYGINCEQKNQPDIGQEIGASKSNVNWHTIEARKQLAKILEGLKDEL